MTWVHKDANSWPYNCKWFGPDLDDVEEIAPEKPLFNKRQESMYVDVDFSTGIITSPSESVSKKDAEGMIQIVEVAINRIVDVEQTQGIVGTKGFMK